MKISGQASVVFSKLCSGKTIKRPFVVPKIKINKNLDYNLLESETG